MKKQQMQFICILSLLLALAMLSGCTAEPQSLATSQQSLALPLKSEQLNQSAQENLAEGSSVTEINQGETMSHFPPVSGKDIDGNPFNLPADFAGNYNVVLMAFDQWHQSTVNTWLPALRELESANEHIRVYEVPALPRMNWLQRKQLDFWMSQGIADPLARATTITLYIDMVPFEQSLDITDTSIMNVFVVDSSGAVYWHNTGEYTPEKLQEMLSALPTRD